MRKGGGKAKGSAFERWVCKNLSLWVSDGKAEDVFWRSAMSGGRSTVARRKGKGNRQAGDICAVTPEGHAFTDHWYIECKNYRNLQIAQFLLCNQGVLVKFWQTACKEAASLGREPMLICKQNALPVMVITQALELEGVPRQMHSFARHCDVSLFSDMIKSEWVA